MLPVRPALLFTKLAKRLTRDYSFESQAFGAKGTNFGLILKTNDLGINNTKNQHDLVHAFKAHFEAGKYDVFEITPCIFKASEKDDDATVSVVGSPHISAQRMIFTGTELIPVPGTGASMIPNKSFPLRSGSSASVAIAKTGVPIKGQKYSFPAAFHSDQSVFKRLFIPDDFGVGDYGGHKYFVVLNQKYSTVNDEAIIERLKKVRMPEYAAEFSKYDRQTSNCGHFVIFTYTGKVDKTYGLEPQEAVMEIIAETLKHADPVAREAALTEFQYYANALKLSVLAHENIVPHKKSVEYTSVIAPLK